MCKVVQCPKCGKPTWVGCGKHVEQVMAAIPQPERCACPQPPGPRPVR